MDSQFGIKAILLVAVILTGMMLLWPGGGARRLALRRLAFLGLMVAAGAAIVFPDITNALARLVGVGRGADLLLYATVIAFIGYILWSRIDRAKIHRQLTELARSQALANAQRPVNDDEK
jgi:Uncharacterized conserved protein